MSDTENAPSFDVEKLAERNPKVNRGQLREAERALEQLREEGVSPPGYAIDSPYQRRPPTRRADRDTSRE